MSVAANVQLRGIRWPLTRWDVAGAFGDIGVLFPIAIALISLNHVDPTAAFLAAGAAYVLAGGYFQIPMAVQPFKAVAAIALATAHYRFGARNPRSSYVIGGVCLLLALFGRAAVGLLRLIPAAVLGVLLVYVGIQHASYLRDILKRLPLLAIAIGVGVVSLLTTNLMWGFLTGFLLQGIVLMWRPPAKQGSVPNQI